MKRTAIAALAAIVGLMLLASGAEAASRLCRQLESRLAEVSTGGGRQATRYDRAIDTQRGHLDRVDRQMRRAGCSGGFSLFGRGDRSVCPHLEATARKMESNLAQLERKRGRMGGGGNGRERARILASLDANGCRDGAPPRAREAVAARERSGNLFEQLFGGGVSHRQRLEDYEAGQGRTVVRDYGGFEGGGYEGNGYDSGGYDGGTYRTLCVRTCDGYYFPISHASTRGDFSRDAQNCQAMCPGSEVRLFSHRVPGEESEQMVAEDGTAYADLPSAFKYREAGFVRPPGCGCAVAGGPKNFSVIAGATPADKANDNSSSFVAAPAPDSAPAPEAPTEAQPLPDDSDRKVRVVGPAYLPDPEGETDLRAPGPTAIQ